MFEILSRFIEKECGEDGVKDWYDEEWGGKIVVNGEAKFVRDEMQELYDWWHLYYNSGVMEKEKDDLLSQIVEIGYQPKTKAEKLKLRKACKAYHNFDYKIRDDLKNRLHRIINVMDYVWM
jgi:hypothetical protein